MPWTCIIWSTVSKSSSSILFSIKATRHLKQKFSKTLRPGILYTPQEPLDIPKHDFQILVTAVYVVTEDVRKLSKKIIANAHTRPVFLVCLSHRCARAAQTRLGGILPCKQLRHRIRRANVRSTQTWSLLRLRSDSYEPQFNACVGYLGK